MLGHGCSLENHNITQYTEYNNKEVLERTVGFIQQAGLSV